MARSQKMQLLFQTCYNFLLGVDKANNFAKTRNSAQ